MYNSDDTLYSLLSGGFHAVEGQLTSSASTIIFIREKKTHQRLCLKMWRPYNDLLYDTGDVNKRTKYLVEGLHFNRQFARNVYLGIAPIELYEADVTGKQTIVHLGPLLREPQGATLQSTDPRKAKEYALVMRFLERDWRLDLQLRPPRSGLPQQAVTNQQRSESSLLAGPESFDDFALGHPAGMVFLAQNIARMHRQLPPLPGSRGDSKVIESKQQLNAMLFNQALELLAPYENIEEYRYINHTLSRACRAFRGYFDQRASAGKIKRCHGDLKASNLWVCPQTTRQATHTKKVSSPSRQLLALDCADFNHPEFYCIDALSDIAMLAIDIEMHLTYWPDGGVDVLLGKILTRLFLLAYLHKTQETSEIVWPLLQYYMLEKAMVCAYMNVIYEEDDKQRELARRYLHIAHTHAQRLEYMLQHAHTLSVSDMQQIFFLNTHSR